MHHSRIGAVEQLPAQVANRPTQIRVLRIHEIALIEPAGEVEHIAPNEETSAVQFLDVCGLFRIDDRKPPREPVTM